MTVIFYVETDCLSPYETMPVKEVGKHITAGRFVLKNGMMETFERSQRAYLLSTNTENSDAYCLKHDSYQLDEINDGLDANEVGNLL